MNTQTNFDRFGIMVDCSRNAVMKPAALKEWIDTIADLGYNTLMLYTEDTYEVPNQPYFGYLRGRYSAAELQEIDRYSAAKGVELIPCIQTLAHLNAIFRWNAYSDIKDCDDIMLAECDKTYQLIEDMFTSLEQNFTSRTVNIGMDEAHMLGRGRYKDIHGNKDSFDVLLTHLQRVSEIAKKHGFRLIMWGDMFFRLMSGGEYYTDASAITERVQGMIPDNVDLVYWDYYSQDKAHYDRQIKAHASVKEGVWFAGGLWSWTGFAPHNGYSMGATQAALESCRENGIRQVFLTMWGDNGAECSRFALLPSLYYAAQLAQGITDMETIKEGFAAKYGMTFDDFALLDLTGTPNACATKVQDPEKYMLYNDLFLGMYDSSIQPEDGKTYGVCAAKLRQAAVPSHYRYLFDTMAALCDVLAIKWDLGLRIREAYQQGDKAALSQLAATCGELAEKIAVFHRIFQTQWMGENKPQGFEVQDIRLGGLMQRVRSCAQRLEDYAAGRIAAIEELEEDILPYNGDTEKAYYGYTVWSSSATANVL